MADHPSRLSEDVLARFNQAMAAEGTPQVKAAPLSTRRSSHSIDMPPRPLLRLRSIDERPNISSRRSSVVSNMNMPFSRKNSICAMSQAKRLSLGPWAHYGRVSFSGLPLFQPIKEVQYENTYKVGPDQDCRFNASKVQKVLENIMGSYLGDTNYNPLTSGQLTQNLSDLIRSKLKEICPSRYKVVCSVFLGQMGQQGVKVSSRSLWDPQNDNFASATFTNPSLFAVATVHGLYYE
ncbi:dynein light chain Tctex-type 4 [Spea bombifrons]|uniref:dynein light chain Tctex-type 4 n=1 Tax=Spea bombifrons TaxID=233779 RepID=UPI00234B607A|nr:dynein light chain Tctex-type 4 [Spea bombifrons]